MSDIEENLLSLDEENLTFSREQIDYLRDEFERQRRWVNLLSTRETYALEELERTQNSISYRFGRAVTWFPRKIIKVLKPKKSKIVYFVKEDEENASTELFPSSLLITPDLLPTSDSKRKSEYLVEEMIIAIKRGNISVNAARDMFGEGSFSMDDEEQLLSLIHISEPTRHA